MATYRYTIKTNSVRESKGSGLSAWRTDERRASRKAEREILQAFVVTLAQYAPTEGAVALCEVSDRFGPRTLAKYSYAPKSAHTFGPTGEVWGSTWILDGGEEGLPDFVHAGVPRKAAS